VTGARSLEDGKAAFDNAAWADAYAALAAADAHTPLDPDDLERLATAAYLIGEDAVSTQARTRAHAAFLDRGETIRAASSAFWLAFTMLDHPDRRAQATGWLARAQRLIDDANQPCVEQGWLRCASAFLHARDRQVQAAQIEFSQAADIGAEFQSADLLALARHGQGRCMLAQDKTTEGLALLDEVMVAVTGGEITPVVAGVVYCSVISVCHDLYDMRRAQEWTTALEQWCASQPDLVPFRGTCLIRRAQLLQLHGSWQLAFAEAERARTRLASARRSPEAGAVHYQMAEVHRLRGEFAEADDAYRQASQAGRKPYPGLALLRLSQGQSEAAEASIRLALQEVRDGPLRVELLAAGTEILLARHDVAGARLAADELAQLSEKMDSLFLRAVASQAAGAVAIAEGRALAALESLRTASTSWLELDAPFHVARVRMLIGTAYQQLRDPEGAQLEFDAAHEMFEALGAPPDAARAAALSAPASPPPSEGLTGREVEVLRLIATGATNRGIATRLAISEKTVARHVSNIFTKLDLSSRAAATAFAYQHKLV
jgi:ATP/maltotriose-dependent transcriptional regulator MalT